MTAVLAGTAIGLVLPALAVAAANCPNEAFRTGPSAGLPDCRAYEMVSPSNKNGGSVDGGTAAETVPLPTFSSPNGEAVTYGSDTTFTDTDPLSSLVVSQYISRRGPEGWSTKAIIPAQEYPGGRVNISGNNVDEVPFEGFSEDLAYGFLVANEPAPVTGAPAGYYNPYLVNTAEGSYTLLSSMVPPVQPPGQVNSNGEPENEGMRAIFAGFSADSSHLIFQANDALTNNAVPGKENLYEYADGKLELVSILPDETASLENPTFGSYAEESFSGNNKHYHFVHSISADGNRVFWTAGDQIYMREGGLRTVDVSASQRTDCADHDPCTGKPEPDPDGPAPATYLTANVEGTLVYFMSCEKLTNDSTARIVYADKSCREGGFADEAARGQDLYQYNVETGQLADITVNQVEQSAVMQGESTVVKGAEVEGMLGTSEDGSYVYFAARGLLAPDATTVNGGGDPSNIYVWHDGEIHFIATLGTGYKEFDYIEALDDRTSRVTADGLHMAFQSALSLTGNDNTPLHGQECLEDFKAEVDCLDVYEYDATTNKLECASCTAANLPPTGNAIVPSPAAVLGAADGWQDDVFQQRYLLDNGTLFFESSNALLPQASNGQQNVYEREPDGVGSCQSAGGCLYLISSGTGDAPSYFIGSSTNGSDAFIETQDKLVPADGDEAQDVYDARIGGGFPAYAPPPCSGEACKPPATTPPPIYQAPPSATFFGAGNPAAPSVPAKAKAKAKTKVGSKKKTKARKKVKQKRGARRARKRAIAKRKASSKSVASRTTRGGRR
jgi:hypothetical protein